MTHPGDVTLILEAARNGDSAAAERLLPLVYGELRVMAGREMRKQSSDHSFAPTDLVHEACLKLVDRTAPWESRAHFFCVAAKAMRSVLVDHARAKKTEKRGGEWERSPLHDAVASFESRAIDLVALDEALTSLSAFDPQKARLVELRFFGGLTMPDVAKILTISLATAEREWTIAKAWLQSKIPKP